MVLALEEDPLMSLKKLSDKLDISWPTVKKRYENAKKEGIIHKSIAHYDYTKLGLMRVTIICYVVDHDAMLLIEEACNQHPYTIYHSRLVGQKFGLFINFNIPNTEKAKNNIGDLFDILANEGNISEFQVLESSNINHSFLTNLEDYDFDNNQWKFSWKEWFANLIQDVPNLPERAQDIIDTADFTRKRLETLRFLTRDASYKQSDIMDFLEISRTESHRVYTWVMENLITEIELIYDRSYFEINNLFLYIIPNLDNEEIRFLYHNFERSPPPIRFVFDIMENNTVLMWGNMNSYMSHQFAYHIWKIFPRTQMMMLSNMPNSSWRYWFYHENFDFERGVWKDSEEWMIDNVLDAITR